LGSWLVASGAALLASHALRRRRVELKDRGIARDLLPLLLARDHSPVDLEKGRAQSASKAAKTWSLMAQ